MAPDKAPWIMASHPSSVVGWPVVSPQGGSICSLSYLPGDEATMKRAKANGRLIVAAPVMADLLRRWVDAEKQLPPMTATEKAMLQHATEEQLRILGISE